MDAVSYSLASKQAQRIEKFIENPDSTSGIVTVPKVIASGESVTIPAGRVAVLPNIQVDGTLNIDGEVFIPSGATFGDLENQIALKADTSYVNSKYSGFKNYIINGDFKVNQYNADTVSAITTSGVFACDRFYGFASQNGKITTQRRSSGVIAMGDAQFENCLQVLTVAGYAPNSTDNFNITQKIEGLNTANLRFGKSSAKTITLSFWVRSSVVGLHCVSFKNSASDRSYVATYTINSANTFEYKTITIQGDTTGTWSYNSGVGLHIAFNLAIGSSFSTPTPNQWVSGSYSTTVGAVNDIATTGNEFILTGIQLEEGTIATPYEQRPYELELSLCQRYLPSFNGISYLTVGGVCSATSKTSYVIFKFNTPTRVPPTGITYSSLSAFNFTDTVTVNEGISSLSFNSGNQNSASVTVVNNTTATVAGRPAFLTGNSSNATILFTGCEL